MRIFFSILVKNEELLQHCCNSCNIVATMLQQCHGICHGHGTCVATVATIVATVAALLRQCCNNAMAFAMALLQHCCNNVATVATVATLLKQCFNNAMALESSETTMRTPKSTPSHGKKFSFSVKNESHVVP